MKTLLSINGRSCGFLAALSLAMVLTSSAQLPAGTVLNIEIDYMVGSHSHQPQPDEIAAVVQMFACHEIVLNIVVDQALPHANVLLRNPTNSNAFFNYNAVTNSFGYIRDHYFGHKGQAGWHYGVFAHQFASDTNGTASGSSGLGEQPGGNFVVTLGAFTGQIGTPFDRAATLAHEFGHNLGLGHGAFGDYQPNKPSIMSYCYQLSGVRSGLITNGLTTSKMSLFKELDYSEGRMCLLDEASLSEAFGSGMVSVDWNCNHETNGVVSKSIDDAASWCASAGEDRNVLSDVNEWAIIHDTTLSLPGKARIPSVEVSCITADEIEHYRSMLGKKALQPAVTTEACKSAKMIYLIPAGIVTGDGRGYNPFTTLGQAQSAATAGSHLFCMDGTYTLDAEPLVLNKPMTIFCNIGSATIHPH